jgi:hypothetical protein
VFSGDRKFTELPCSFKDFAAASGIEVFSPVSHTLFDPAKIIEKVLYSRKHLCSFLDRMFGVMCLGDVFIP